MTKIDPEFAYQSRELEGQIDGILGDPPNRRNYQLMVSALRDEYANGSGIADLNMMSFALVDVLKFNNNAALLKESMDFNAGNAADVIAMASCEDSEAAAMYTRIFCDYPQLARQAVITAFLYKNPRLWSADDTSLDALGANDDGDDKEDDDNSPSADFSGMFDQDGDEDDR